MELLDDLEGLSLEDNGMDIDDVESSTVAAVPTPSRLTPMKRKLCASAYRSSLEATTQSPGLPIAYEGFGSNPFSPSSSTTSIDCSSSTAGLTAKKRRVMDPEHLKDVATVIIPPGERKLSVSGKNWGEVDLNGTSFVGDGNRPPAQVFCDRIMSMADVSAGGEEAVVTFDGIAILTPRGCFNVELYLSFLLLQGQASDFKIQYSSVVNIFLLPKHNQPHTLVVITLDPPIQKGQTLYQHIVLQFETDKVVDLSLALSEDLLNTKYKDLLLLEYKGLIHDMFAQILRGLSGAIVTKPGMFRSSLDGYAVKSSLEAEDGLLYPLEKCFFFLPKPPTLILHEEIDYVEFERHAAATANMHYFDLLIRLKTGQELLFRNIQRNEYHSLFDFISSKGLKMMNLNEARAPAVPAALDDDNAVDPHLERIENEADGDERDEEPKKEAAVTKPSASRKKADDNGLVKKQKEKEYPNAQMGEISAFMFFSQSERENVLGERWNELSAEEKEPYEAMARAYKKCYSEQNNDYKNPGDDSGSA